MHLGGSGHQPRQDGSPRKMSGSKSSANSIVTLAQMAAADSGDSPPSPYTAQQGRVLPQRFPPGSSVLTNADRGRKTFNDLRKNMSQNKMNWERQGEEPEYSMPMQPNMHDNPKDPIRVLKGVFNKDVSITYFH